MDKKYILDACCGGRMFHFDKVNPYVVFMDKRNAPKGHCSYRPNHSVEPDLLGDFRKMPFPDESFHLIIFDPPHIISNTVTGHMEQQYGTLSKATWSSDLTDGFNECWRVLKPNGTLIFKWAEARIPIAKVLALFPIKPIIGHKVGSLGKTVWCTFFKLPNV
jgi:SAM-dependent methyltransferase